MYVSQLETKHFGFRFGRLNSNVKSLNIEELEAGIIKERIDVCRIKILGSDQSFFRKLKQLNYIYDIYNVNYYNRLEFKNLTTRFVSDKFTAREVTNPETDLDFIYVLTDVIENKTWIEYDSFLSRNIMPEERRKALALEYYPSFTSSTSSSNYTGLLYEGGKPIGIFMGYFTEGAFFGNMFGLIKACKGRGYAKYFYNFMYDICISKDIYTFENEVNIFNFESQKSALTQSFIPQNIYYNITIYPFCNLGLDIYTSIALEVYTIDKLLDYVNENYRNYRVTNTTIRKHQGDLADIDNVKLRVVIQNKEGMFIVAHFLKADLIRETCYIEMVNV